MIDLSGLIPFQNVAVGDAVATQVPSLARVVAGQLGPNTFVVTVADDGSCEASLTAQSGRLTPAHIAAFWMKLGASRPTNRLPTPICGGRGLHWMVEEAVLQ